MLSIIRSFLLFAIFSCIFVVHAFRQTDFLPASSNTARCVQSRQHGYYSTRRTCPTAVLEASKEQQEEKGKEQTNAAFPELKNEAEEDPGLKVTPTAWAWPPNWPYTDDYFDVLSPVPEQEFFEKKSKTENDRSFFNPESEELLKTHLGRFIPANAAILELGAGVNSYLPSQDVIPTSKVVGIGLSPGAMEKNPRLTESKVQNLNEDTTLQFEDASFDVVMITNSVEFFTKPLDLYREIYRVLKVEGRVIMAFTGTGEYSDLDDKKIKLFRTMNSAQQMWICGSYCKFSADIGFTELKGYELTPDQNVVEKAMAKKQQVFVVQAKKDNPPTREDDTEFYLLSLMANAPTMELQEKKLVTARLAAAFDRTDIEQEKVALEEGAKKVGMIYDVLKQISDDIIYPALKAKCAAMLAPKFDGSEDMLNNLKQGLGLQDPSESFWIPLGECTAKVGSEDKIMMIAELTPLLSGSLEQQNAVNEMITLLPDLIKLIQEKQPEWSEGDCQLLAVDLMITDYLNARSDEDRQTFVEWTQKLSVGALELFLDQRKNYKSEE
mmetsp:Transcript_35728/g.47139  ORF Transcript_35728/g.47139 Transcript_35728/m.47139 type:complete len:552 (-) Transcript_35728:282-1937(-)